MEGPGRAPARTEADLRATLAELARRAPSADDVLSAVREAGSRRQRRSARLPGQQWPAGPGRVRTRRLGWRHKTTFDQLVKEMVEADLTIVRQEHERKNRHD